MADSNRNVKIVAIALAALLLLGGTTVIVNSGDDDDNPPDGSKCPKGFRWSAHDRKCVAVNPGNVDPGGGKVTPGGECPPGMIKNAARLKALAKGLKGAALEEELKKYPECVPIQCPQDHKRTPYGDCIPECPEGMSWSPKEGKCLPHPVNCPPGEQWSPSLLRCVKDAPKDEPTDNDDPKDIPSIIKDFPEGGNFYQVRYGDTFEGTTITATHVSIAHAYLKREAYLAAKEFGNLSDDAAMTWATNVSKSSKQYMQAFEIILCAGSNDHDYGTYGYCGKRAKDEGKCRLPNGTLVQNHPGMHGRAIQLEPKHPDNVGRLLNGEGLARGVTIGNSARRGDGSSQRVNSSFTSLPLLWMPLLDRATLWSSGGKTIKISTATWSDNTTKGWPPPIVVDRGLHDYADTGINSWGCMGMEMEGE